jgi:hypothetical protein
MNKLCKSSVQFVNKAAPAGGTRIYPHSTTFSPQLFRASDFTQSPAYKGISGLSSDLRRSIYYY